METKASLTPSVRLLGIKRKEFFEALECSVCLEQFDFDHKVLPCQHTFCKSCLEKIQFQGGVLKCPECRLEFHVNINDLPSNIILVRILNCVERRQFASPIQQTVSKAPESSATHGIVASSDPIPYYRLPSTGFSNLSSARTSLPVIIKNSPMCHAKFELSLSKDSDGNCLSFKKGDTIFVRRRIDKNWAEGKLNDKIGIFPIAFVEMNSSAKLLMKYSMDNQNASLNESSNENQKTPEQNLKLPYLYVAICQYKPKKLDELELRKGHIYLVAEKCRDGWYKGQSVRTLNWGMFPGNYVVRISSESNKPHANSSQLSSKRNIFGPNLLLNENVKKAAQNEKPTLPPRGGSNHNKIGVKSGAFGLFSSEIKCTTKRY